MRINATILLESDIRSYSVGDISESVTELNMKLYHTAQMAAEYGTASH